jgi:hypothetical protein
MLRESCRRTFSGRPSTNASASSEILMTQLLSYATPQLGAALFDLLHPAPGVSCFGWHERAVPYCALSGNASGHSRYGAAGSKRASGSSGDLL